MVPSKDVICWNEGGLLTWKDYKGKAKNTSNFGAMTYIMLQYNILTRNSIHVTNCVIKKKSWVLNHYKTPELLKHEQYHFHLSEIFARGMRKELSTIIEPSTKIVQKIYDKWIANYYEEQDLYDKETAHSQITSEQLRWQTKIDLRLEDLSDFADEIVYLNQ